MNDVLGDNKDLMEGAVYVQQRISSPIAVIYASFIIFLLVAFILQRTILKWVWLIISKSLRVCCFCCFKNDAEKNKIREEQQRLRELKGIDAWSEDYIAECQVSGLKDMWERFLMEK